MHKMDFVAVILAGGLGKRMESPLPKVLHLVGSEPMIVRIIKEVSLLSPKKIFLVVGKYKSIIETTLANYLDLHVYNIEFVIQEEALGTGHAIQCCVPALAPYYYMDVLILSGDVPLLNHVTMLSLLSLKQQAKLIVTHLENPTGYGRIIENLGCAKENQGCIQIIEEKDCTPVQRQIQKINGGIYAIQSDLLCQYITWLTNDNAQKEYYLTDVIRILGEQENIHVGLLEIPNEKQYEIMGVNTAQQLADLEKLIQ